MRQKITPIDGGKNDIRLIVSDEGWSEDSGIVDGEPIDPPDATGGWLLVDFWVEYDEEQRTEERDVTPTQGSPSTKKVKVVTTRKIQPQLHALWVKPKAELKKAKKGSRPKATAPKPEEKKASEPRVARRRTRGKKKELKVTIVDKLDKDRVEESLWVDQNVPVEYIAKVCPHTKEMLHATINVGEGRLVSYDDASSYTPLCHDCQKTAQADGATAEA